MRKLLYLPFGLVAGQISKRLGKQVSAVVWSRIDPNRPPPPPGSGDEWGRTVAGAAINAASNAAAKAAVDRAVAQSFYHVFGLWPVKPRKPAAASDRAS
jgi:hypothetical protein